MRCLVPGVANTLANMMVGVVTGGTGRKAQIPGHDIAGKTGTTQDNKTAAFGGITPDYAVGVMYFDPLGKVLVGGDGGGVPAHDLPRRHGPDPRRPAEQAVPAGRSGGRRRHQGQRLRPAAAPRRPRRLRHPRRPTDTCPRATPAPPTAGNARPARRRAPAGAALAAAAGTAATESAELAADLRGDACRRRPGRPRPPLAAPMTLPMSFMPDAPVRVIDVGDERGQVGVLELGGQVAGEHLALGPLPLGLLGPAGAGRTPRRPRGASSPRGASTPRTSSSLRSRACLAGDLLGGDGGERHAQGGRAQLVAGLHGGGQVGTQAFLEVGHSPAWHGGTAAAARSASDAALVHRPPAPLPSSPAPRSPPTRASTSAPAGRCAASTSRCSRRARAPLSVLHISDLHMTAGQRSKQEWVAGLAALEPDLVINTGDNLAGLDAVAAHAATRSDPLLDRPGRVRAGAATTTTRRSRRTR